MRKPPAGHRHGGGLEEETINTRHGRWQHRQPREGGEVFSRKTQSRTTTKDKECKLTHRPVHSPYHVTREQGTMIAPRLWA